MYNIGKAMYGQLHRARKFYISISGESFSQEFKQSRDGRASEQVRINVYSLADTEEDGKVRGWID